jgi:hypothetical protein
LAKGKRAGGMGKTTIFYLPSLTIQNREEQYGRPVEGGGAPATQAMGTAGMWGKIERRSRATHSAPHLSRGWTVEGDRQWQTVYNRDGTRGAGGGDGELGKEGELAVEVRDEVGSRAGPFIGAGRRFGQGFLSSRSFDGRQWWWGKSILALTLGRRASEQRSAVDVTLCAGGRCGGGDRPVRWCVRASTP